MSQFKNRFKQERLSRGITQKDLSEILGVDRTSISKYENGKQLPEVPVLEKIASYFDVSTDYLLGKTDERNIDTKVSNDIDEEKDLEEEIEKIITSKNISFCGEPLEDEDMKFLRDSLKATLEFAKSIKNKK